MGASLVFGLYHRGQAGIEDGAAVLTRYQALAPGVRQFVGYLAIGAFTTSLNFVLFAAMVASLGWRDGLPATVASTTAYVATSVIAYVLNSRIAFRSSPARDSGAAMARFAATFASSAGVSALVFSTVNALAGESSRALAAAQAASIATVIAWNFTLLRLWVFTPGPSDGAARAS